MAEDEVPAHDLAPLVVDLERPVVAVDTPQDPPVDLEIRICREQVEVGSRRRERGECFQPARQVHVVGVENRDELARRGPGGRVLSGRLAAVLLPDEDDPLPERRERRVEVVGRPVVADDHLVGRLGLAEGGRDRLADAVGDLVGGDQDRERRRRGSRRDRSRGRRGSDVHGVYATRAGS